ncbi:MAG: GNAT family N-acetyltransferase [Bacilli bacterium]|nr:GNAT family N-acetyltransferase [Bacilli bacterium]
MIREALEKDAERIVYINVMSWKNTYKHIFPQDFLDSLNPMSIDNIEKCKKKINQYIVYEVDNKVVGFARFGLNKKNYGNEYGEIHALYLDDNYKGMNIGTELVKYIFEKLKSTYKYVLISTLVENNANTFYKKLGGKFIGQSEFELEGKKYLENVYEYVL